MQTLVFPSPGTDHTYPHKSAPLRGCATSGLPVSYAVDREQEPANCNIDTTKNPPQVVIDGTNGGCTIIASQPGDSTWAPARPVQQQFRVGWQPLSLTWADPVVPLPYPGTLSVRVRITSPDPFQGMLAMSADGACGFGDGTTKDTTVTVDEVTIVSVRVTATNPESGAECALDGHAVSDHTLSSDLDKRIYTVVATHQASSSPSAPSGSFTSPSSA